MKRKPTWYVGYLPVIPHPPWILVALKDGHFYRDENNKVVYFKTREDAEKRMGELNDGNV